MSITINKKSDIDGIRAANRIVAQTLDYVSEILKPGLSLIEIDMIIDDFIRKNGAVPSFKGLYGFPNSACLSLNEVCIHGIPSDRILRDGDILGVDIGTKINGFFGDSARTFPIGDISNDNKKLIDCAKNSLYFAIDIIRDGMRFKELSYAIECFIKDCGFTPLKGFCGHGIGRRPHEEPEIPNYLEGGNVKSGPKIKNGMVFCIEPMICQKSGTPVIGSDNWAVTSSDGLNTSHYEHCVAIIDGRAEILSQA